jgi:hypothetical protein
MTLVVPRCLKGQLTDWLDHSSRRACLGLLCGRVGCGVGFAVYLLSQKVFWCHLHHACCCACMYVPGSLSGPMIGTVWCA